MARDRKEKNVFEWMRDSCIVILYFLPTLNLQRRFRRDFAEGLSFHHDIRYHPLNVLQAEETKDIHLWRLLQP
jgi:hypothetical protein